MPDYIISSFAAIFATAFVVAFVYLFANIIADMTINNSKSIKYIFKGFIDGFTLKPKMRGWYIELRENILRHSKEWRIDKFSYRLCNDTKDIQIKNIGIRDNYYVDSMTEGTTGSITLNLTESEDILQLFNDLIKKQELLEEAARIQALKNKLNTL